MQATSPQSDTPARPALRIDRDVLLAHRDAAGITTNALLAERIGVDESTLQRVLAHAVEPSGRFIKGLLQALPKAKFEDLFQL
jgi:hypothetical protein